MIQVAVEEEIPRELAWLSGYDKAFRRLHEVTEQIPQLPGREYILTQRRNAADNYRTVI